MKIAFDWDGTTWGYGGHKFLCDMALALKQAGWEVVILSQVPQEWIELRRKDINALLPDFEAFVVANWSDKPIIMKEHGIEWLIDDNEMVCQMVKEAGLHVLQVK